MSRTAEMASRSRTGEGSLPRPLRETWLCRLGRRLGLRQRFRSGNATFAEVDSVPLWEALYARNPRGYKDYEVRFDDGFRMRIRQTRERSYADVRGSSELFHYERLAGLLEPGWRVLDAACGSGYGARWLADRGARVTGLDLSEEAIAFASHRYPGVRFVRGDVCRLPLGDGGFDLVASVETFEHLPDASSFVAEVHRVLRPGGLWYVTTPAKGSCPSPFHVREYTREEFVALLRTRFPDDCGPSTALRTGPSTGLGTGWRWLVDDGRWMELLLAKGR